MEIKTEGAIIRSKAKWSEFGEKDTKYFLNFQLLFSNKNVF